MPELLIETRDLCVTYGGFVAVEALNLQVFAGQIYGLIGPNGAGKTSTMRALATLQEPSLGYAFIGGFNGVEQPGKVHRILGFMPDLAPIHDDLKVWEVLDFYAGLNFLSRAERRKQVSRCLGLVGLEDHRDVIASTLSRGMTQRCIFAKTLLHDPDVLILDEPASGVDPIARMAFRNICQTLASEGKAILVSSHILTELDGMCDAIGVMREGKMVDQGLVKDIAQRLSPRRRVAMNLLEPEQVPLACQLLQAAKGVHEVMLEDRLLWVEMDDQDLVQSSVVKTLVMAEISVVSATKREMDVESIMLHLERTSHPGGLAAKVAP